MNKQSSALDSTSVKNYIKSNPGSYVILYVLGFLFLFIGFFLLLGSIAIEDRLITKIAIGAMGLFLIIYGIHTIVSKALGGKRKLHKLTASGQLPAIIAEFDSAEQFAGDTLRLSQHYIFCKGSSLYTYSEISRVYKFVQKVNGVENRRSLNARLVNGSKVTLCNIKLRWGDTCASEHEVQTIIESICSKNSSVKVGYK